jgi:hypothetical protein
VLDADWSAYDAPEQRQQESGAAGFFYGELNKTGGYGFDGNFW